MSERRLRSDLVPKSESSGIEPLPTVRGFKGTPLRQDGEERERDSLLAMLGGYWFILIRRKLVVALVLALAVGAGYLWLQQQVPIYRATAKVIINYDPPKVLQNVRDVIELGSPKEYRGQLAYFETQYRIITSFEVAILVLNREGLWNDPHLLGLDRNKSLSQADIDRALATIHQPSVLAGRIGVRPVPNSMMVQIDFDDSDPKFAQRVVNAVANAYKDQNVLYRGKIVDKAMADLEKNADAKRKEVDAASQALLDFELKHNLGSIEATKGASDDRTKRLNAELTDVRILRNQLEAEWKAIAPYAKGNDPLKAKAAQILANDIIRVLKQQIVTVQAELAELTARYLDKHPEVIAKEQQLATLMGAARREVQNISDSVKRKLEEIKDVEAGIQANLDGARLDQQQVSALALEYQRKVESKTALQETMQLVSKRLSEMRENSKFEETANNVRVLDEAITPTAPISPRRTLVLAGSFLLGLFLALGVALFIDYADSTVKDWKDIEDRLGQKVLGVVPVIGTRPGRQITPEERRERDLYIHRNPASTAAEASRSLRTNLLFMSTTRKLHTLLITSASPSEGKSMMAAHVATSVATSGSRVLLVEADMRRPRLAGSFKARGDIGLSNALVGTEPVDRFVQKTEVPNLDLLACGPVPPNPAELLHTPRFFELLNDLKTRYDTIIFDSPPILPVADALVLAQEVDGVLVIVRAGQTSRHALRHAVRSLSAVEAPILGMVLNYQVHKSGGYGYGYGYGYGHSYGYTSKAAEQTSGS